MVKHLPKLSILENHALLPNAGWAIPASRVRRLGRVVLGEGNLVAGLRLRVMATRFLQAVLCGSFKFVLGYFRPNVSFIFTHMLYLRSAIGLLFSLLILCSCKNKARPKPQKPIVSQAAVHILIQPFEEISDSSIRFLKKGLGKIYRGDIKVLSVQNLPTGAWYAARHRYWADSILRYLKPISNLGDAYVLGVTGKDISTQKSPYPNWGIMGLGLLPGRCCVVSDYRMNGYPRTREQIDSQLLKVAIHELGHNFGLPHCPSQHCFMVDAEGKNKLDTEFGFCEKCTAFLDTKIY